MKTVSVQLKGELGPLVSLPDLVPRSRRVFCPRTAKTRSGDEISPSPQSADACLVILIYGFHTSPVLIPNPRKLSLMPIYCSTKKVYFAYYLSPHLEFVSGSLLLWENSEKRAYMYGERDAVGFEPTTSVTDHRCSTNCPGSYSIVIDCKRKYLIKSIRCEISLNT